MNRLGFFSIRRRDETIPLIYSSTGNQNQTNASGIIHIINGSPNQSITLNITLNAFVLGGTETEVSLLSPQVAVTAFSTMGLVTNSETQIITLNAQGNHQINWSGNNAVDGYFSIHVTSAQAIGGANIYNP